MKVLITGISGKIGRMVAELLLGHGHEIIGVDRRDWPDAPAGVTVHQADIRKRGAAEVFRSTRPEAVIHMATVSHITTKSADRYRINLHGTRAVFDHCHEYGARRMVFVGRHTYYGASPDTALYHKEDAPPMAVTTFPELSDLVAADLYACTGLWRFPEMASVVLRVCYTLGPAAQGTLAAFLRGPRVPTILGFDPLFQFMHELDAARAIVTALESDIRGVFNVAGPNPVPLSLLIRETGRLPLPVPEPLFRFTLGRFGLPRLPRGAIEHLKHPVVIDKSAFYQATGFMHEFDEDATMHAFRDSVDGL